MAKTKTTTVKETLPDESAGVEEGFFFGSEDDELLQKIRKQYGDGTVKFKVYRVVAGKPVFITESTENVDEAQLQEFGAGRYAIRIFINGEAKDTVYVEVADKPGKPAAAGSVDSIQNQLYRDQIQFGQQMILALINKNSGNGGGFTMQDAIALAALVKGNGNGVEHVLKGLELGLANAGGGGGSDWKSLLVSTLKEFAPAINTAIVANAPPQPNGQPAQLPAMTQTQDQLLIQALNMIKAKVIAGLPVGLALDWLVANASDPQYQNYMKLALSKSFEDLVKLDNELANEPFNSWFREFLLGMKEHFKEQTQDAAEDE